MTAQDNNDFSFLMLLDSHILPPYATKAILINNNGMRWSLDLIMKNTVRLSHSILFGDIKVRTCVVSCCSDKK